MSYLDLGNFLLLHFIIDFIFLFLFSFLILILRVIILLVLCGLVGFLSLLLLFRVSAVLLSYRLHDDDARVAHTVLQFHRLRDWGLETLHTFNY